MGQKARQGDECWVRGLLKSLPGAPTWGPRQGGADPPDRPPESWTPALKWGGPRPGCRSFWRSLVRPGGTPPLSLWLMEDDDPQAGPSLPVERGTAHRVDGAAMGREGELGRGPQGHRAGHPREGGLFRCQGTLEWEAAFRAQNEKAGVKAGESHRRGAHLGLAPVRLWRSGQQGRAKGIWSVSQRSPGARVDATAQRGRGPARRVVLAPVPTSQGSPAGEVPQAGAALGAIPRGSGPSPRVPSLA